MKITKKNLEKLIKEEIKKYLLESNINEDVARAGSYSDNYADSQIKKGIFKSADVPGDKDWDSASMYIRQEIGRWANHHVSQVGKDVGDLRTRVAELEEKLNDLAGAHQAMTAPPVKKTTRTIK